MSKVGKKRLPKTRIIPEDWDSKILGNVAKIRGNKRIHDVDNTAFIPMDFVSMSNIYTRCEIRPIKEIKSSTYCEGGDLLLAKITPSLENGKQGIVPDDILNGFALATTEIFPIHCQKIQKLFLFYVLKYPRYRNRIISSMTGTTGRQRATKTSIENLKISLPPLPEQNKIAEILSTVDEAIEKVDEAIKKAERLKKGLMQTLLTRGIGHKEFKETKIGMIPKDWELVNLPEAFEIIDGDRGVNYPSLLELHEEGYCLFLNAKNVTNKGLKFIENRFINKEKDIKLRKGKLIRGDIVITTRGTVGNIGLYNHNVTFKHMRINSGMAIFRFKNNNYNIDFYYYLLQSNIFQKQIKRSSYGSAQYQLSVQLLKKLKIFLIEKNEQNKIAEILSTTDQKLELMRERKCKLNRVKKGLMNDLLSGKRRVKL